jgi:hypothetical protein
VYGLGSGLAGLKGLCAHDDPRRLSTDHLPVLRLPLALLAQDVPLLLASAAHPLRASASSKETQEPMFVDTDRLLRVHGVSTEDWAERHGLLPFSTPCYVCGAMLTTSIPFASGEYRGLVAPNCECGDDRPPYCLVRDPRYGDLLAPRSPEDAC